MRLPRDRVNVRREENLGNIFEKGQHLRKKKMLTRENRNKPERLEENQKN